MEYELTINVLFLVVDIRNIVATDIASYPADPITGFMTVTDNTLMMLFVTSPSVLGFASNRK